MASDPSWLAHARFRITPVVTLGLMTCLACGADLSVPVDVPDEVGLGERLALIAWLGDHQVAIADPQDLKALRLSYLKRAHPEHFPSPGSKDEETERGEAAAELYRRFRRNPAAGTTAQDIRALITRLEEEETARISRDQEAALRDDHAHPRPPVGPPGATTGGTPRTRPPSPPAPPIPSSQTPQDQQQRKAANDAARAAAGIVVGQPFPRLSGRALDGADFDLSQWRGKVVLVDFWATWCGPCMHEMPHVAAAYKTYHDHGFEVVGVSLDHDRGELQKKITELSLSWPQLCDGLGWKSVFARQYAIHGIPAAFLIGKEGELIAADLRGDGLKAAIAQALGVKP